MRAPAEETRIKPATQRALVSPERETFLWRDCLRKLTFLRASREGGFDDEVERHACVAGFKLGHTRLTGMQPIGERLL